jgi:hypothetical protein
MRKFTVRNFELLQPLLIKKTRSFYKIAVLNCLQLSNIKSLFLKNKNIKYVNKYKTLLGNKIFLKQNFKPQKIRKIQLQLS